MDVEVGIDGRLLDTVYNTFVRVRFSIVKRNYLRDQVERTKKEPADYNEE